MENQEIQENKEYQQLVQIFRDAYKLDDLQIIAHIENLRSKNEYEKTIIEFSIRKNVSKSTNPLNFILQPKQIVAKPTVETKQIVAKPIVETKQSIVTPAVKPSLQFTSDALSEKQYAIFLASFQEQESQLLTKEIPKDKSILKECPTMISLKHEKIIIEDNGEIYYENHRVARYKDGSQSWDGAVIVSPSNKHYYNKCLLISIFVKNSQFFIEQGLNSPFAIMMHLLKQTNHVGFPNFIKYVERGQMTGNEGYSNNDFNFDDFGDRAKVCEIAFLADVFKVSIYIHLTELTTSVKDGCKPLEDTFDCVDPTNGKCADILTIKKRGYHFVSDTEKYQP